MLINKYQQRAMTTINCNTACVSGPAKSIVRIAQVVPQTVRTSEDFQELPT
jgi:hypothetical protein